MKMKKLFLAILSLSALTGSAGIIIQKAASAPKLDGIISAGEWPEPLPYPFKKVCSQLPAEEKTEVRMQYDNEYLYVAISNPVEIPSTAGGVFTQPRYELRLGKLPEIKVFAVTLDGRHIYPANGWNAAGGKGAVELRIPLSLLSGFRIYSCNIVRDNGKEGASLFPIPVQVYTDLTSMRKISLGTPEEITAAEKQLQSEKQSYMKKCKEFCRRFAGRKSRLIPGAKAQSFQVPEAWKPYRFSSGKDFHFMFSPRMPFVPNREDSIPLFQDAAYEVHDWYLDRGFFRDKSLPLTKLLNDPASNPVGYILQKTSNPIMYCTDGGYHTVERELQEKKESREEFVRKYGSRLLCLDINESVGPGGCFPMMTRLAKLPAPKTKTEAYEQLHKISFDTARTYIRDWAVFYPELASYRAPISATHTDHIYLSFGFGMSGQEYGPKTLDMPFAHCVSRGAARQYGKPFRYYLTSHDDKIIFPGCEKNSRNYSYNDYRQALRPGTRRFRMFSLKNQNTGKIQSRSTVNGPRYGVPKADWRRCFIYTYMAGGNVFFDECGHWLMYANYNWKTIDHEDPLAVNLREPKRYLSDMGAMMADFYDRIVCREDRGVVYTPIALLWDLHHGNFRNYTPVPWGFFNATEGDRMMHGVEDALFPKSERIYYNRGFRTGPYGDIFDVITNDASEKVLNNYPVIFFCGDVPVNPELARKLVDYVRNGGTLAVNWKQVEPFAKLFPAGFFGAEISPADRRKAQCSYSNFSGKMLMEDQMFCYTAAKLNKDALAAVFTADERKDPLVIVSSYGKGKVILSTPDFLKEQYTERMLNIFHDLIAELRDRTLPLKVEGDVQYMVHRNSRGWLVSLFNNYGSGFSRTWDNPENKNDPRYDAAVTIIPNFKYRSVREWFTGERKLTLNVPAGDVRVVEIVK